jgi:phenylalanyl-tRNA synthetase beta chain
MGGEESAVTAATKRVVLEGAYFAPSEARRSSQKTRLRSDSSYRFERGCDPKAPRAGADRAAALILQIAGGSAARPTEAAKAVAPGRRVESSVARLNAILGASFPENDVLESLRRIAAELTGDAAAFSFAPPSWRRDLATANDLAEEAGRFLGYDEIPYRMAPMPARTARVTPVEAESRRARTALAALGLCEAYNYDLLSEKALAACRLSADAQPRVAKPLSEDWALMRPSLLPGLLKNAEHNLNRGADAVRFFEIGKAYAVRGTEVEERWRAAGVLLGPVLDARWQPARSPRAGFHDAKACVEDLLAKAGEVSWKGLADAGAGKTPSDPLFHPVNALRAVVNGIPVATVGWLHPRVARAFSLEREGAVIFDADLDWLAGREAAPVKYREFSALPSSRRDIAIVVAETVPYGALEAAIRKAAGADLQGVEPFDVYQGKGVEPGKKSVAVRLTFGAADRTLTDAETAKAVEAVVAALGKEHGATLRG